MELRLAGENAVILYCGDHISPETSMQVQAATAMIEEHLGPILIDLIPSYTSVLILYKPAVISYLQLRRQLLEVLTNLPNNPSTSGRELRLPVYYGPEVGLDLDTVAEHHGLTRNEVIALHSHRPYRVYALGFAPGFAYLGTLDERIATPRLSTPRPLVPKGSVAIADGQTAVYPQDSPGGWNLIGRCPLELFSPQCDPFTPFAVGDTVIFEAIGRDEFMALGGDCGR